MRGDTRDSGACLRPATRRAVGLDAAGARLNFTCGRITLVAMWRVYFRVRQCLIAPSSAKRNPMTTTRIRPPELRARYGRSRPRFMPRSWRELCRRSQAGCSNCPAAE